MIRLLVPVLVAALIGWFMLRLSLGRTRRSLDAQSAPLADPGLEQQAMRLARALDLERIPIRVLDTDAVNGLADADGRVFLTRGFLERKRQGAITDEELATVIAHELGHIAHGHMRRRTINATGQSVILMLASRVTQRFVPFIGPWLVRHAAAAVTAHFSRRDEFEADAWASALLIKAGIGTAPQKSLFAKLDRLAGTDPAQVPAWLRSHPTTRDRIAAIEDNEARWQV